MSALAWLIPCALALGLLGLIAFLAGCLDPPTGLSVRSHIFVADKSDFYAIEGDAPRYAEGAGSAALPPKRS